MARRKGQLGFTLAGDVSTVLEAHERALVPLDVEAEYEEKRAALAFNEQLEVFDHFHNSFLEVDDETA